MTPVELWDAEQLAAFLHRKPGGVRKAAQRGELPFPAKTRKPWTWLRSDVEAWVQRRSTIPR